MLWETHHSFAEEQDIFFKLIEPVSNTEKPSTDS